MFRTKIKNIAYIVRNKINFNFRLIIVSKFYVSSLGILSHIKSYQNFINILPFGSWCSGSLITKHLYAKFKNKN